MKEQKKKSTLKKIWPLLVSAGSASLMILAFFLPSIQDQWDRYQSRQVIQQYEEIGDDFVKEENYKMAVEAFTKAYDLSGETRLDIEVKRLSAKVNLIYQDPVWGSDPPEGLEEVDFQFLLHMQKGSEHDVERASILTSYGVYLASVDRIKEAEKMLHDAIRLNPNDVLAYINLGNLSDELEKKDEAAKYYEKAIALEPGNVRAHYNLGLLFSEQNKLKDADEEFAKTLVLNPQDSDALVQQNLVRERMGR